MYVPVSQSTASSRPSPVRALVELYKAEGHRLLPYTQLMNILNIAHCKDIHREQATHKVEKVVNKCYL